MLWSRAEKAQHNQQARFLPQSVERGAPMVRSTVRLKSSTDDDDALWSLQVLAQCWARQAVQRRRRSCSAQCRSRQVLEQHPRPLESAPFWSRRALEQVSRKQLLVPVRQDSSRGAGTAKLTAGAATTKTSLGSRCREGGCWCWVDKLHHGCKSCGSRCREGNCGCWRDMCDHRSRSRIGNCWC